MGARLLSPIQDRAIARVFDGRPETIAKLARLYRVRATDIGTAARRGGYRPPRKATAPSRFWTPEQLAVLRERYPHMDTAALAAELGRSRNSVYGAANVHGLAKDPAYMAKLRAEEAVRPKVAGTPYRIKPGQVPPNKGRKGVSHPGCVATQFKKGAPSNNTMPIGAERDIEGYLYRKVADVQHVPYTVNWKPVHVLQWEAAHGPVPSGHVLRFRDGNRRNFDPANIELLSLAENMQRNTIHRYPPELRDAIRAQAKLTRAIAQQEQA